jgi:hypothetical protein
MKINLLLFFSFISLIFYLGCKDTTTNIDSKTIPDSNVSFGEHIFPVFQTKCAIRGCHDDGTKAGGISLTTWVGATDPNIVVKGEPDNSPLVWSIEALAGISPMPPIGYPPLTQNQINGIKTWIKEGAKNN